MHYKTRDATRGKFTWGAQILFACYYTGLCGVGSSARNLGIIFHSNLSFSDHISYISKSCFSHIRDLRRIRNTLDHKTACTIATSLIHSKLDYCNSLYLNISNQQLNRLQLVLNSATSCCHKNSKIPSHYSSSQITSLAQNYATHTIQNSFSNLQVTSVQKKPSV